MLLNIALVLMLHFLFLKLPKRRVTWGGRLAQPPACGSSGDLSFAEPFSKKWKPDHSCLTVLGEGKHSTYNMSRRTNVQRLSVLWCH